MKKRWRIAGSLVVVGAAILLADRYWAFALAEDIPKASRIVVEKSQRRLFLTLSDGSVREYSVALGGNPIGAKDTEGDSRTPEGEYEIEWKKEGSRYFRALRISYPTAIQRALAETLGNNPGGDIMIHGQPNGFGIFASVLNKFDWTDGCVALSNVGMAELWNAVDVGTPIQIKP